MLKLSKFSDDGQYRYWLLRAWDESKPLVMCIGLNPSNAGQKNIHGEEKDDPTIRILISSLAELGFGGFYMMNLYALVTPHPTRISAHPDPVGDNEYYISKNAKECDEIIFCWGAFAQAKWRARKMKLLFKKAKCFGKNADGSPWHPRALHYQGIKAKEVKLMIYDKL